MIFLIELVSYHNIRIGEYVDTIRYAISLGLASNTNFLIYKSRHQDRIELNVSKKFEKI